MAVSWFAMFSDDHRDRTPEDNHGESESTPRLKGVGPRAGSAPPTLFFSGWGTTDRVWDAMRANMYGTHERGLTWIEVLQDTSAIDRVLESHPEPWLLVGWSLGGILALRAALARPDRLAGLVLVSATARMTKDGDYPGVEPRVLRAMQMRLKRDTQRLLFDFAGLCAAPDGGEAIRSLYLDETRHFTTAELATGLEALATFDLREELRDLAVPTLVIHGELDGIIPIESARALATMTPNSRLKTFEHRGHALPLVAPSELAALVRGFAS
jgi:pimeloyl-[acyl-carrier protein] methyl ester esterase